MVMVMSCPFFDLQKMTDYFMPFHNLFLSDILTKFLTQDQMLSPLTRSGSEWQCLLSPWFLDACRSSFSYVSASSCWQSFAFLASSSNANNMSASLGLFWVHKNLILSLWTLTSCSWMDLWTIVDGTGTLFFFLGQSVSLLKLRLKKNKQYALTHSIAVKHYHRCFYMFISMHFHLRVLTYILYNSLFIWVVVVVII